MSFEAFASELDAIVNEVAWEDRSIHSGSVVVTTVDRARGARARHILPVNLARAFPTRNRSSLPSASEPRRLAYAGGCELPASGGSADESLTLAYPTRDEKGQEILASGFLNLLRTGSIRRASRPFTRHIPGSTPLF